MQTGQSNQKQEGALSMLDGGGGVIEVEVDAPGPSKRITRELKAKKPAKGFYILCTFKVDYQKVMHFSAAVLIIKQNFWVSHSSENVVFKKSFEKF